MRHRALLPAALLVALALPWFAPDLRAAGDATQLVEEANRKVRRRDVAGALQLLEQAIKTDPSSVDAHVRYQDLLTASGGGAGLQATYAELARTHANDVVAQFLAARLLPPAQAAEAFERLALQFESSPWPLAGRARALEELGKATDAAALHSEALARAGDQAPRFLAYRAYGLERAGQWQLAADAWKAALERNPKDLTAVLGMAEAHRRGGNPDASLAALDQAVKSGAKDGEIAYRRGLVEADAGRWDTAVQAFDQAFGADASLVEAACASCEALLRQAQARAQKEKRAIAVKDLERALAYARRVTDAAPESGYAHFVAGAIHEAAGTADPETHDAAAVAEYAAALDRWVAPGPDRVAALTAKSFVHLRRAEWAAALDAAQKAIDLDRTCLVAYGHGGHALCALAKQQDAIARFYRPGLRVHPKSARLHHDLGVALWELKKDSDARKSLEEARDLEPRNGRWRLTLGEFYFQTGRMKDAFTELFEATDLLPDDPVAWRSFARACFAEKSWAECVRAYEKVTVLDPAAVEEWLYIAVVQAEQLDDRESAKKAIAKYREKDGKNEDLEDWIDVILKDGN